MALRDQLDPVRERHQALGERLAEPSFAGTPS